MKNDKRAEMGVGTMIIFIAMVLVAAVAASVLISTANQVREQAQATGNDAINNVATGFVYQDVVGTANLANQQITGLDINIRLAAGSPDINLNNTIVSVSDGATVTDLYLDWDTNAADAEMYGAFVVRDATGTASTGDDFAAPFYIHQGDMIKVTLASLTFAPSTHVTVKIMPAYGQSTEITFTTPETYSTTSIMLK